MRDSIIAGKGESYDNRAGQIANIKKRTEVGGGWGLACPIFGVASLAVPDGTEEMELCVS